MTTIVAARVAAARKAAGLSQRALAERAGITRQAVSAMEAGRMQPSVGIALALARVLATTVEALFAPDAAPAPARRVVSGTVAGRSVEHPLDGDQLATEPGPTGVPAVFVAGCDVALGLLTRHASERTRAFRFVWLPCTNRDALRALAQGRVHAAGIHAATRDRVTPALDWFDLAAIEEGWLVARGNPRGVRSAGDVSRARAQIVNRPNGSGARALLDAQLRRAAVDPAAVRGYERVVPSQLDAGRAVAQGFADAAVGMASVAQVCGLDFIPLREERCALAVGRDAASSPEARALLDALGSQAYRRDLQALGYDVRRSGDRIA